MFFAAQTHNIASDEPCTGGGGNGDAGSTNSTASDAAIDAVYMETCKTARLSRRTTRVHRAAKAASEKSSDAFDSFVVQADHIRTDKPFTFVRDSQFWYHADAIRAQATAIFRAFRTAANPSKCSERSRTTLRNNAHILVVLDADIHADDGDISHNLRQDAYERDGDLSITMVLTDTFLHARQSLTFHANYKDSNPADSDHDPLS